MKYGVYIPNYGDEMSPLVFADMAAEAEAAGWDGFFLWDHILLSKTQKLNIVDPWITLAAVAMKTTRLRFGTTLTPLPRRHPWRLARETTSLDQLSNGRLILSVGLGTPEDTEYAAFGENPQIKVHAEKLDEGLEILNGLWSGKPFSFQGVHYQLEKMAFRPTPVQKPRIPIWVGGFWPNKAPFRRAARWDGVLPLKQSGGFFLGPDDLRELLGYIKQHRTSPALFDAVIIGTRPGLGKKPAAMHNSLKKLEEAGATWWLQSLYLQRNSAEKMRTAIREGPPEY